ncbi:MAG: T9SS type A sorting domain-containing protein, partial [Gemmatimonadetes bacterium]|nr:T9SS type A sorting domain-containing protein [Gemmatimonadota bacterium]
KPGDPNTVYAAKGSAATGNSVKISTDDGVTWATAGSGQPVSFQIGKTKLGVTAADPNMIYAAFASADGTAMTGIYRSTDGGANWTAQNTSAGLLGGQNWYNLVIVVDPNDANKVILGGQPFVRSTNGGVSYSSIGGNVHVDFHAIAYEPGSDSNVWVGSDGGIWRSVNDGSSWTDMNNGIVTYQFYDICVNNGPDPYYVMGGTQDNGTDKWSGTTTWANGLGADGMVCNINPGNGTVVYAEIQSGGHRKNTTSGIGTWSTITSGLSGSSLWVAPVDESQQTGNTLFTSTSNGIFRTTNGGSSWQNVDGNSATWIAISPVDENIVWTVAGTPRYSTNGGNTWQFTSAYGFGTGGARKIIGDPVDPNTVMVVFSAYSTSIAHVARSTDLGATWTDVSGDFPGVPANAIEINPADTNEWFVGTDLGVWTSTNGGVNWLPMGTGLPNVVVDDLEIKVSLGKLVAGTHGRGAWEIDLAPVGTDVNVAVDPADLKLMLDPPSPNPVSDRTMLRYAAKHDGPVSLEIYDVQGRLVSDLQDFARGDGVIRTTPWFTDDVVAGVYFAVLRAGDVRKTQKIIVTK